MRIPSHRTYLNYQEVTILIKALDSYLVLERPASLEIYGKLRAKLFRVRDSIPVLIEEKSGCIENLPIFGGGNEEKIRVAGSESIGA